MWVKTQLVDDGIALLWQVRTRVIKGILNTYDANGEIESSVPIHRATYGPPMRIAGTIPLNDEFVEYCGMDMFEDFGNAVMRHAACLLACGHGDRPEDIVEWFTDLSEGEFIQAGNYKFIQDSPPFNDIGGLLCTVYMNDDNDLVASVEVSDDKFDVLLNTPKLMISFMISTKPV